MNKPKPFYYPVVLMAKEFKDDKIFAGAIYVSLAVLVAEIIYFL